MSERAWSDRSRTGAVDLREPRPSRSEGPLGPRVRILEATLTCIARGGIAGLALDDVAREAGCGRATVYRVFPGGRDEVIAGAIHTEFERFDREVGADLDEAGSLEDLLTTALVSAARFVEASAPLGYLFAHEPAVLLAHVAFDRSWVVFQAAHDLLVPRLERFVAPEVAGGAAEWLARLALSHLAVPTADDALTDPVTARRLVTTFVLPGLVRSGVMPTGLPTIDPVPSLTARS